MEQEQPPALQVESEDSIDQFLDDVEAAFVAYLNRGKLNIALLYGALLIKAEKYKAIMTVGMTPNEAARTRKPPSYVG